MAYCNITHVEARNVGRGPYSTTTKPTASQVSLYICDAAADIDFALSQGGYNAPIGTVGTPTATWNALRSINSLGASFYIENAAQTSDRRDGMAKAWEAALEMLRSTRLPGMEKESDLSLPRYKPSCGSPLLSIDMSL